VWVQLTRYTKRECYGSWVRRGWPRPRFWQRSVEGVVKQAVRYADDRARRDREARHAMDEAARSIEGIAAQAEALKVLEAELGLR